ncbi:peptidase [Variovorax sp. ZS18.2.2]|uniref:S10 family serine carboxypeptidase-like protein n=1 Tax=Variovorax sp. ZS18.2.2 TaxID=2971255 RepID=UPI002150CD5F|nr:peptidase [Variovorax sp. ZS18.2.2]MCR6480500.1 peptidase [Variovorax sp. ZS18.2.2]
MSAINEDTSVKQHTITINGKVLPYVARAGHLVAYRNVAPTRKSGAEAAVFYTSYTRDALPKENRPVTFLWNGGPGSASIWLHMGSWGPKRLKSDAPNMPDPTKQPESFPFEDNAISLLDKSDIVFVDPPGTGLSTAIAPLKNKDLWGTDIDAQVVADFITAYINKFNRQSSPKYLYGESYGGIRTPIVANLLEQAGTSHYMPDLSGKPAKVLAGFILNSPLVNYNTSCEMTRGRSSCEGYIPSYAMVADYLKKSTKRGTKTQEQYLAELRTFARTTFKDTLTTYFDPSNYLQPKDSDAWSTFAGSTQGKAVLDQLEAYTGISTEYSAMYFNFIPAFYEQTLIPGSVLGRYDGRMMVPDSNSPDKDADSYINLAFLNQLKTYFPDFVNYKFKGAYQPLNDEPRYIWKWARIDSDVDSRPQSITDIQAVLTFNPDSKILILHGYEDIATSGFQTELDLEGAGLISRIPVKWFEGGHMIYNTESSRAPLKQTLDDYYALPTQDALGSSSASVSASALQLH